MLLGPPMPAPYAAWRFVEGDLYDTTRRVSEYDPDARVVRHHHTGQLGLARWHKDSMVIRGGRWIFARELYDLDTDLPLLGEPDGRVLRCQRAYDSWRIKDMRSWVRRTRDAEWRAEARLHNEIYDQEGEPAERFVHALRKDVEWKPRAFIPKSIGDAA